MLHNPNSWKDFCELPLLQLSGNHLSKDKQGDLAPGAAQGAAHPEYSHGSACFLLCNMLSPAWSTPSSSFSCDSYWALHWQLTAWHWQGSPVPQSPVYLGQEITAKYYMVARATTINQKRVWSENTVIFLFLPQLKFSRIILKANFALRSTIWAFWVFWDGTLLCSLSSNTQKYMVKSMHTYVAYHQSSSLQERPCSIQEILVVICSQVAEI